MIPLTKIELFSIVKMLSSENCVITSSHAKKRLTERNIPYSVMMDTLLNPKHLIGIPEFSAKHNTYGYKIKGGKSYVSVVIAIKNNNIIVITVI